jgi:hypothetical protein
MQKKILILILLLSTLFFTSFVFAQDTGLKYDLVSYSSNEQNRADTPFFNISIFNQKSYTVNYQNFATGFQFFFDLIIGISIATAVIVFMIGAFEGIINKNVVKDQVEAKQRMTRSIVGLMIILSTWLIINTVNPDLLRLPMFQGLDNLKAPQQSGNTNTNITAGSIPTP